ncbi:unnamed protein product [Blepharisma stoltei]|uniref:Protein kinase domain-containing protein n=1 Tax=Blepharisma stoltei TaxID=1481888 RepID=A0AAU9IFR1_9CILI|nr:unnamed protein product [Blepharisma stoltei]
MSHDSDMDMSTQTEVDTVMDVEDNSAPAIIDKIIRNDMDLSSFFEVTNTEYLKDFFSSLENFYELGFIGEKEINFIVNRFMRIFDLSVQFKYFPKDHLVCKIYQRNFDFCIMIPYNLLDQRIIINPQISRDEYEISVENWLTEFMISQNPKKVLSKNALNSYEKLPIDIFKFDDLKDNGRLIGQGGFGKVYWNIIEPNNFLYHEEGINTIIQYRSPRGEEEEEKVVIKLYKKSTVRNEDLAFINEARFLMASNHENVIRYFGIVEHQNMIGLVLEHCSEGSLKTYIKNYEEGMEKRIEFAIDATCGLAFMHSKGISHLDIKPDNIFVCANKRCKLGDFGLALGNLETNKRSHGFTINYAAPEILQKEQYTEKSDIWSLGMTLYWLFLKKSPCDFIKAKRQTKLEKFSIGKEEMIYQIVYEGNRPPIDKMFEGEYPELANLIRNCWELNGNNRPTAYDALLVLQQSYQTLKAREEEKKMSP